MSETSATIIVAVAVFWGLYLNTRLERAHRKLDLVLDQFRGLREYLYEIDPQFDEERRLLAELHASVAANTASFAGMLHMDLLNQKKQQGKRTLDSPL